MKLEQQVCSLELAKRLEELGVKQGDWNEHNLFYWSYYDGGVSKSHPELISCDEANFGFMEDLYSAFTVAELGEMIPVEIEIDELSHFIYMGRGLGDSWVMGYRASGSTLISFTQEENTEADARAKMLVYLLENKLINQ